MNAIQLLEICHSHAVNIELADGEHLTLDPVDRLPEGVLNQIKQHKRDIIEYLSQQQPERIGTLPAANCDPIAPDLSPLQARALKGYYWRLGIKRDNLLSNGYAPDRAKVRLDEWRRDIGRIIGLGMYEIGELERELISLGVLAIEGSWIIEGNGQPLNERTASSNSQCLYDGTGRGFLNWLEGNGTIH